MTPKICFATAFYHSEGNSPNLRTSNNKFNKYYQCMIVLFASLNRFYKKESFFIFTDKNLPEEFDKFLTFFNITVVVLEKKDINYVNKFENKFPGCLFSLDVFKYFDESLQLKDFDVICLLDSDIVMQKNIFTLSKMIFNDNFISGIHIEYPFEKLINGHSRKSLSNIYNNFYKEKIDNNNFKYYGGEFYFFTREINTKILLACENLTDFLMEKDELHGNIFTEEHILTILLNNLDNQIITNKYTIKRLWTTDSYHNIQGDENEYSFLHMPAEKDIFFKDTFNILEEKNLNYLNSLSNKNYEKLILSPIINRLNPSYKRIITIVIKKYYNFLKNIIR